MPPRSKRQINGSDNEKKMKRHKTKTKQLNFINLEELHFPLNEPFVLIRNAVDPLDIGKLKPVLDRRYPEEVWQTAIFQGPKDTPKKMDGKRR